MAIPASAQQDVRGSSDHPLISRFPDTFEKAFKTNGFKKSFACKSDANCGRKFVHQLYWYGDPSRQGQNTGLDAPNTHGDDYTYYYWTGTGKAEDGEYLVTLLVVQITINLDILRDEIADKGKVILDGVFFDFDKSTLTNESIKTLSVIAEYLKANKDMNFYVVGHTDSKGSQGKIGYYGSCSKSRNRQKPPESFWHRAD